MQIGKWLYKMRVYFHLIFMYGIFPWRLDYYEIDMNQIIENEWNSMRRYRMYGTIFKGLIRIDFRPHNREFWWKFLSRFMFVGDVLYTQLTHLEQLDNREAMNKWKRL